LAFDAEPGFEPVTSLVTQYLSGVSGYLLDTPSGLSDSAPSFSQEDIAELLHTKKSNISRLENVHSKISPTLSTIEAYAKAAWYKIEFKFIPQAR
jgi:hypothetical protein